MEMAARGVERGIWLGLGAVIAVVMVAGLWSLRGRSAGSAADPPVIAPVPGFTLVERSGQPLSRDDLAGRPWVADFIFTRCSGMCPALSARMAELRRALRERGLDARLVSFSVDPSHDTPEVLREYAAHFGADNGWLFVTGERDALYQLIGQGFKLSVAERAPEQAADGGELITHSDRFILVDAEGRIRGYYHGADADAVPALVRDLAALAPRR
jgi:protein SCO1